MTPQTRPSTEQLAENFSDLCAPLSPSEAAIEADRCYFCYDAPCTTACPTSIDVPLFIQKIRSNNLTGSARTILSENIMGAMCARVCPTEMLCEEACVRNEHESKPVEIGALQRFATDPTLNSQTQLFERAKASNKKIAVVGAGPAGLSCAHRLAVLGHEVDLIEASDKVAGLNEFGIAAYKATDNIAQTEAQYILDIGGITTKTNTALGTDVSLSQLQNDYDAVFLSMGLASSRQLGLANEQAIGVYDAIDYIADLRQSEDKRQLSVGKQIVVIGGGMTAIDIAVQSKLLGAEIVTIVYRRGPEQMGASEHEQALALTNGVRIVHWASPTSISLEGGKVSGMAFQLMSLNDEGKLVVSGKTLSLAADTIFKAIGQLMSNDASELLGDIKLESGRITVDEQRRTSVAGIWAGGDCVLDGDNLTVAAVQDGKLAALSIDQSLTSQEAS